MVLTRDQVDVLQAWGIGLERSGASEELRAAGRAVRLLVEQIEQLERGAWHERAGVSDVIEGAPAGAAPQEPGDRSFLGALAMRLAPPQR
jgi:hypothetical protein